MPISQEEKDQKFYDQTVQNLNETLNQTSNKLDKLIFIISTQAIILTIPFIDKIVTLKNITEIKYLKSSWAFFFVTLILNILTYYFSIKALDKRGEKLDYWFENPTEVKMSRKYMKTYWAIFGNIINHISLITLILGLGLLAYFASINIEAITK
ncbi:MAG: hypothetical protein WC882_02015 [Candidatus Gracilibacteria bacterium]